LPKIVAQLPTIVQALWTVDGEQAYAKAMDLGADMIISNTPKSLQSWLVAQEALCLTPGKQKHHEGNTHNTAA
jgi:hypothetical protein